MKGAPAMNRTRLTLLGLCAAVFAVMAFGASAAQANEWLILTSGGVLKTAAELPALVGGTLENNDASVLTTILGSKVKILCTAITLVSFKLEAGGILGSGGKIEFTGCKIFLEEEEAPECEAKSAGNPNGTIETNALKGELGLHGTKIVIKIKPVVGTV